MSYRSTKTFGHDLGLSACFRQWRAKSHCRFLHGYALSVGFVFEADELDANNWVVDFGALKPLKEYLQSTFDHKLLVAHDDPWMAKLLELEKYGLAEIVVIADTGCERFAELIYDHTELWMSSNGYLPRCRLVSVEVKEHGANSAIYMGEKK